MNDDGINIQTVDAQGKSSLNYETVFNLHVIRTNQLMQNITSQKGVQIPVIMSLIASIMSLDGLIANGEKMGEYKKEMLIRMDSLKKNVYQLGDIARDDDKKFITIWWDILDIYNYQIRQMYNLGLTPADDEDDIVPTVKEKIEKFTEVPQWFPEPDAFDYKKELGLPPKDPKYISFLEEVARAKKEMREIDKAQHSIPA